MEKQTKRKTLVLTIIAVITLIALVAGATYAYFSAQVGEGQSANLQVKAGTTDDLSFSLSDLNATKEKVVDNDSTTPIVIEPNQTNFASGENSIADGVTGTATLIANDENYKATKTYNVYLNITKNELNYSSYIKKVPDETPENILSFKDETKKEENDLSNYNPRPELYLTIKKNEEEIKTGVTINGKELNYSENVFTKDDTQLGGFDITETKGLIKIEVPATIEVNGSAEEHTETDRWEITVTFMNLDTDQHLNTGKSVVGEVLIQSEIVPASLAEACTGKVLSDCIKENYKYDGNIIYHNAEAVAGIDMDNKDKIAGDDSFRFSGSDADVKNYVCLDSKTTGDCESDEDLYRIIGLFKNDEDKYEAKLIKAEGATATELGNDDVEGGAYYYLYLPYGHSSEQSSYKGSNWETLASYFWSSSNHYYSANMWQYSNLNKVNLNQFYYNYITTRATYLQNHITEHTWTTGGYSDESDSGDAKATYDVELGDEKVKVDDKVCYTQEDGDTPRACTKEDIEYKDHIGLMYISDYMYGASPTSWSTTANNYSNVTGSNWLYSGVYEWSISRSSETGGFGNENALSVYSMGNTGRRIICYYDDSVSTSIAVRPSFYLTSDAKIKEGEGTKERPYRIFFE